MVVSNPKAQAPFFKKEIGYKQFLWSTRRSGWMKISSTPGKKRMMMPWQIRNKIQSNDVELKAAAEIWKT